MEGIMREQTHLGRRLKQGLTALALLLAISAFSFAGIDPSFGETVQITAAPTLATPTITAGGSKGYDSAKIIWSAVSGATFYEVYYTTSATGSYVKAGTSTSTSFTKTGLTTGKTYYFKVRAGVPYGSSNAYSKFSSYKAVTPIPSTPVVKAASASYNSVKVSWSAITGASGYRVYRSTSATGTYTYLGATKALEFTSGSLVTGKTYYYKVIAYRVMGTLQVFSKSSTPAYAKPIPAKPTATVSTKTMTKALITWTGVSGASRYQIWRCDTATGTFAWVATVASSERSYINTGLSNGKTYYYKVRAYHIEGTTKVYGYSSSVKSVKIGSSYAPGFYKVGTDIPVGEFLLTSTAAGSKFDISTYDGTYYNIIAGENISANMYVTLKTGQYLRLAYANAVPIALAPLVTTDASGNLMAKQYKVGRDIPAGTYVLYPIAAGDGTFEIYADALYLGTSMVGSNDFLGRCPVTVSNGEYLNLQNAMAYPQEKAPAVDLTSGSLSNGVYLVGTDFPAGTYYLTPNLVSGCYYLLYKDILYRDDSNLGIFPVSRSISVTLKAGDYVQLYNSTLALSK
jgi:fibronectin type 3 domain-containing protein